MTAEIRIYIEGGGDGKDTKARLRSAFGSFLRELRDRARARRIRWNITVCGGRQAAFDGYCAALHSHPSAVNLLLVDAEAPVTTNNPWTHLKSHSGDNWDNPGVEDKHCHLMVQVMEAWLIADRERLSEYYGPDFRENAIPRNPNVEQVDKRALAEALRRATRNTTKGEYHKTRHAPEILERARPGQVRGRAPFCERLFRTILVEIDAMGHVAS